MEGQSMVGCNLYDYVKPEDRDVCASAWPMCFAPASAVKAKTAWPTPQRGRGALGLLDQQPVA